MKHKDSFSRKVFNVCNIIFFLAMSVIVLFPYLNMVAKSFNDGNDTAKGGITIWPRVFTLENYKAVMTDEAFLRSCLVSVSVVVLGTILSLLVQYMAGYVFLNKRLIGHKFLMMFLMIPRYFGGGLIPMYILFSKMGLLNNYLIYIIPGCFSVYNMIIIRSYLSSIPYSLHEAARVDGANDLKIAFQIILPLSKPVIATVGLWLAVAYWNNWTTTLYYVTKKELYTMSYVLQQVLKEADKIQNLIKEAALRGEILDIKPTITTESVRSAQLIVTTLPIVLVYPFLQKYFIQGVTLGAVKD